MSFSATVLTLYPEMFPGALGHALAGRALAEGRWSLEAVNIRDFATDRHRTVDDTPAGGGAGMVMRVDVAGQAVAELAQDDPPPDDIVLLSPAGEPLTQPLVQELAQRRHLALLSGRYEGFDARVERLVTREISIGDYVLMGGELPALVVMEAVARLVPGVLGDAESHQQESFTTGLLDYPEYTRPPSYQGLEVPEVLKSGHHGKVAAWRRLQALRRTFERRPELLERAPLTEEERALVAQWRAEAD